MIKSVEEQHKSEEQKKLTYKMTIINEKPQVICKVLSFCYWNN